MKAKRNQRAWDSNDEPRNIDQLPPSPRKKFKRLSREILDRAESHRANGAVVPFYELEEWAAWAKQMEEQLRALLYDDASRRPKGKAKR